MRGKEPRFLIALLNQVKFERHSAGTVIVAKGEAYRDTIVLEEGRIGELGAGVDITDAQEEMMARLAASAIPVDLFSSLDRVEGEKVAATTSLVAMTDCAVMVLPHRPS